VANSFDCGQHALEGRRSDVLSSGGDDDVFLRSVMYTKPSASKVPMSPE
jgi:hypothetical protein